MMVGVAVWWTLAASAQQPATLRLSGTVKGGDGKVFLLKYIDRYYDLVDSAEVKADGSFDFSNQVVLPEIYGLSVRKTDTPLLVFLDEGDIRVTLNAENPGYRGSAVTGSATQDLYDAFHRERGSDLTAFISEHPKSIVPLYVLYREYVSRLSSDEIVKNLSLVDESLQQTNYAKILRDVLKTRETIDVGQLAPDFRVDDVDGRHVSLKDFTGKGYLLIDFWASWCGPCRRENPNVVKTYHEWKDKGFDVLAISLDKTRDAWLKGIEQDKLPYHHVSELRYWDSDIARLYGIRAIPSNVLVDKNGVIVAKNLRGEELGKALEALAD